MLRPRLPSPVALGVLSVALTGSVSAQPLPAQPLGLLGGGLVLGAEVSAGVSNAGDPGFFNYTDYEHNALRLLRLAVSAELRLGGHAAALAELRTENLDTVVPYALYLRLRPWRDRAFDLQAGRIPPVFGTFARRHYATENPLVGTPLAYQYLTSLRSDALPASPEDLVRMRGRGWRVHYPVGDTSPDRGLPLVNGLRWDSGVQARIGFERGELAAAWTAGALSAPWPQAAISAGQVSARAAVRPRPGLVLGGSWARGAYLGARAGQSLEAHGLSASPLQQAAALDVDYSAGHWIVRGEAILSRWEVPMAAAPGTDPVGAAAAYVEARYRFHPRGYVAGRADRLTFSRLGHAFPGAEGQRWEAPVSRVELGLGWYLERNLILKVAYQHNRRDTVREPARGFLAGQAAWWF